MPSCRYVFIGDDFTGASDTLATLADRGWNARLFLTPTLGTDEDKAQDAPLDAIGFATDFRALGPDDIRAELQSYLPALEQLQPKVLHYKVCSTFDSAPNVGNIGATVHVLEDALSPGVTLVLGGQPSLGRYCAFGNLYARGPDGAVHRIDRHPVMKQHPITPMAEADLRLHLAAQGLDDLELVSLEILNQGTDATADFIRQAVADGQRRFLLDATEMSHLATIRDATSALAEIKSPLLVVGASSVAETFAEPNNSSPSLASDSGTATSSGNLPTFVVAGSRSSVTAQQVAAARSFHRQPIQPRDLQDGERFQGLIRDCQVLLTSGQNALFHLQPDVNYGMSGPALSEQLARFVLEILKTVSISKLGIAGGDTSSIVARNLGFESLSFEKRVGPGTAVCRAHAPKTNSNELHDGLRILFKGGQVGPTDIFDAFASDA